MISEIINKDSVLPDHAKGMCEAVFKEHGFDNCEMIVEPACEKYLSYLSKTVRIRVNDVDKKFSIISKSSHTEEYLRSVTYQTAVFANELLVYNELFPRLDELQNSMGISEEDRFDHAACYKTINSPSEVILLEDLCNRSYRILEYGDDYGLSEVFLALNEFAKFHALVFLLKLKDTRFFESLKHKLVNFLAECLFTPVFQSFHKSLCESTSSFFKKLKHKKILSESTERLTFSAKVLHQHNLKSEYSNISLGLYRRRKLMYKIEDNTPKKVIFLDFQQARVATPASDLHFFLLHAAGYDMRKKYYKIWLDHYFSSLTKHLSKYGLSVTEVYPREEFEKDLKRNAMYSLGVSVVSTMLITREQEINKCSPNPEISNNPDQWFKETILGLMDTMIDMGYSE